MPKAKPKVFKKSESVVEQKSVIKKQPAQLAIPKIADGWNPPVIELPFGIGDKVYTIEMGNKIEHWYVWQIQIRLENRRNMGKILVWNCHAFRKPDNFSSAEKLISNETPVDSFFMTEKAAKEAIDSGNYHMCE